MDYLAWRGDLDFTQVPFNPVDNLILSQFSYLPLDGIVPGPDDNTEISLSLAAEILGKKLQAEAAANEKAVMYKDDPALLAAMGSSVRFGNCRLCGYVNNIDTSREIQFSAVCIIISDNSCFIAYRGTDMTLVGWKEDFNMSFYETIPAQHEAAAYLETMAQKTSCPLRVGGHSKGGNLAIYAASKCCEDTQMRITDIYSNDAPGFHKTVITSEGFLRIRNRIRSFVPQASVVGMLLDHGNDYSVIKSVQFGLMQHELYSWEVSHNDMIYVDKVTMGSRIVDKTLREWIDNLDITQREKFFEALYTILAASQAKSLSEIEGSWFKATGRMLKTLSNVDDSTKALIRKTLAALVGSASRNIKTMVKEAVIPIVPKAAK